MARIEGSPELRRRDGRERDPGKKGRKGERGSVGGDTDVWGGSVSEARRVTVRWGEADGWARGVSERRRALGWASWALRERERGEG